MIIDIFTHIMPVKYVEALERMSETGQISKLKPDALFEARVRGMTDVYERFKLKSALPDIKEVLTLTGPFIETLAGPEASPELARIANDELAKLVLEYPDRFIAAIAALPMNNIRATLEEIDRAVNELNLRGVQIATDIDGKPLDLPEYMPIYAKLENYGLPIFLHPSKNPHFPDYPGEDGSKHGLFQAIGWPHSTSIAMLRLVLGQVLEKFPKLKIVTHHAGGTIPYLAARAELTGARQSLPKPVGDYLRRFFNDTAVGANTGNLMCAYEFFGDGHLAFGTDFPFRARHLNTFLDAVNRMTIAEAEKINILSNNALSILSLKQSAKE